MLLALEKVGFSVRREFIYVMVAHINSLVYYSATILINSFWSHFKVLSIAVKVRRETGPISLIHVKHFLNVAAVLSCKEQQRQYPIWAITSNENH
jgi:hypothetical protein